MPKRRAEESEEPQVSDGDDVVEEDESSSSSGDDSDYPEVSSEGEGEEQEEDGDEDSEFSEINVDFEFFDPKEKDFHGLKALLNTYLDGQTYDCSGLVDTIIAQQAVGTVVKAGEDDDPLAVLTVLNTVTYKDKDFMKQLREFLAAKCQDPKLKQRMDEAFSQEGTGLMVSERLVNCPPQMAPPLLQLLFDEIGWAAEDEDTEEVRKQFMLKRYLHVTRVYSDPLGADGDKDGGDGDGAGPSSSGGKAKKQKTQQTKAGSMAPPPAPALVYVRPEDQFLHQAATWAFQFPVEGRPVAKDELRQVRLVMLLEASKVAGVRKALDTALGNAMAGGAGGSGSGGN